MLIDLFFLNPFDVLVFRFTMIFPLVVVRQLVSCVMYFCSSNFVESQVRATIILLERTP